MKTIDAMIGRLERAAAALPSVKTDPGVEVDLAKLTAGEHVEFERLASVEPETLDVPELRRLLALAEKAEIK